MFNFSKLLSKLNFFHVTVSKYFFTIRQIYDPISSYNDDHQQPLKQTIFFISFLIIFTFEIIGVFGLDLDARGKIVSWSSLSTSPYIVNHQMMPPEVWQQFDALFFFDLNGALLMVTVLYLQPMTINNDKFRLVEIKGCCLVKSSKKKLSVAQSSAILSYRNTIHRNLYPFCIVFLLILLSFFYLMVYFNGAFCFSVVSIFFWVVIMPTALFQVFIGI